MKVRGCDMYGVIIEMTKSEFKELTGTQVGDSYGNHGIAESQLVGKEYPFPLEKFQQMRKFHSTLTGAIEKVKYSAELLETALPPNPRDEKPTEKES